MSVFKRPFIYELFFGEELQSVLGSGKKGVSVFQISDMDRKVVSLAHRPDLLMCMALPFSWDFAETYIVCLL